MAYPTMLLPLDGDLEGQDRDGTFEATGSGAIRYVDSDTTQYQTKRPYAVSSPEFSEDEIGEFDPVVHQRVTTGTGRYGPTWRIPSSKTPPATFLANFDRNLTAKTQNGDVELTANGPVRYAEGAVKRPLPDGIDPEPTTNLCTDPRLVNATSNAWGTTFASRSAQSDDIDTWVRVTRTSEGGINFNIWGSVSNRPDVSEGTIVTLSAYVRSDDSIDVRPTLAFKDGPNGTGTTLSAEVTTETHETVNGWTRRSVTGVAPTGAVSVIPYVVGDSGVVGHSFDATKIQIEFNDHATAYCDGDMGDFHGWLGDRHASASVRGNSWATTNLMPNPTFDVDITNTALSNAGVSLAHTTDESYHGASSFAVSTDGVSAGTAGCYVLSVSGLNTTGARYTASLYVKMPHDVNGSIGFRAYYTDGSSADLPNSRGYRGTGDWQRLQYTTTVPSNRVLDYLRVYLRPVVSGTPYTYYVDAVQLEEGSIATPFVDPDNDPNAEWLGEPHASASKRWGTLSQAYVAEEGTTNLVRDPFFTDTTTYWPKSALLSRERDASVVLGGSPSLRVEVLSTDSTPWLYTIVHDIVQGDTITASVIVRGPAGKRLRCGLNSHPSNNGYTTTDITLTGEEQRLVWSGVHVSDDTLARLLVFPISGGEPWQVGDVYWMGQPQLEKKPYATSFCPQLDANGDLLEGYSWTGTPHASASTREPSTITADPSQMVNFERGSVVTAFRLEQDVAGTQSVFQVGWAGNHGMYLRKSGSSYQFFAYTPSVNSITYSQHSIQVGEDIRVYCEWGDGTIGMSVNNGPMQYYTMTGTSPVSHTLMYLGRSTSGGSPANLNGVIDGQLWFDRKLTDEERNYVFNADIWEWGVLNLGSGDVQVGLEATENLIRNPYFSVNTTAWASANGSLERSTEWAYAGPASGKLTVTGPDAEIAMSVPLTTGDYTYSAVVKNTSSSARRFQLYSGLFTVGPVVTALPDQVVYLEGIFTANSDGTRTPRVRMIDGVNGDTFHLGHYQVEKRPYATPPCPAIDENGELLPHYHWTDTPHASTSIRTARADAGRSKSALIRYTEDNEPKTQLIKGSTPIGTTGYARFRGGTLTLEPQYDQVFEVEGVSMWDVDVESVEEKIAGVPQTWTRENSLVGVQVPIPAVFVEEGTTNFAPNPMFEGSGYGLSALGGATVTYTSEVAHSGTHCYKIEPSGSLSGGSFFLNTGAAAGQTWTVSAFVLGPVGHEARILLREGVAGTFSSETFAFTGEWQRVSCTRTLTDGDNRVQIRLDANSTTGPSAFYADDIQIEQKSYATSFCPQYDPYGNLLQGYSWTGTPHASASTREKSYGYVDHGVVLDPTRGSVIFHVRSLRDNNVSGNRYLLATGTYGNPTKDFLAVTLSINYPRLWTKKGTLPDKGLVTPNRVTQGEWSVIYAEWDGAHMGISANGGSLATMERPMPFGVSRDLVTVGSDIGGGQQAGVEIGPILVFDRPLSQTERDTLFNTDVWEWNTTFPDIGGTIITNDEPIGMVRSFTGEL